MAPVTQSMKAASGPSEPPNPMSTASSMCSPTWAMSPRKPMSAIWGWAHEAEQPEKCMRMTPASPVPPPSAPPAESCASRERAPPLPGSLLGLHYGEAAELRAGARHHAPLEGTGEGRIGLHQRLGQQVVQTILGDAREDEVLVGADADRAIAVGLGQSRRLNEIDPVHAAQRDRAADVDQAGLLLGMDPHVVPPEGVGQLAARGLEGELRALVQGGPEPFGAEFLGP